MDPPWTSPPRQSFALTSTTMVLSLFVPLRSRGCPVPISSPQGDDKLSSDGDDYFQQRRDDESQSFSPRSEELKRWFC